MPARTLVIVLLLTGIAARVDSRTVAVRQPLTLEPTPLEALAQRPDARTVWSRFVGRLDGGTASAIVSAVTIEGFAGTRTLRGVRIDLRHEGARPRCDLMHVEWAVMCDREQAAVFIEEERLERFRAAVLAGQAEIHPGHRWGVTHFSSGGGDGILIAGYSLYGRELADLADLLARSATQLQSVFR